jgi:hypothetical protein
MQRIWLLTIFLLLIALPLASSAEDASFQCKNARTPVELRICNSPYVNLKQLDRDLSKWYKRALLGVTAVDSLRDNQREWLQSLNTCLTDKAVEPTKYVCDHVSETDRKAQCFRDFCLAKKYIDRNRFLYTLPTKGLPGRYVLSDRWPSGIRQRVLFMAPEDRALCKFVESTLSAHGPHSGALTSQRPFSELSDHTRVSWVPIDQSQLLPTARRLERLLRQKHHHETGIIETVQFSQQLADRIASGEITISISTSPARAYSVVTKEDKEVSVLRYQRWADGTKNTELDFYQKIEFFQIKDDNLVTVYPIGSAEDVFIYKGRLYFDSTSERTFDDRWQFLPIPQAELYVYTIKDSNQGDKGLRPSCHLLYVQEHR